MKYAIVGSRHFNDLNFIKKVFNRLYVLKDGDSFVSGGASGADSLAEDFANEIGLPIEVIKADWDTYGKAAGPIRNEKIVKKCDILLAFLDGDVTKGTSSAIELAKKHNKTIVVANKKDSSVKIARSHIEYHLLA